ncbi:MAG: hypothetical protein ABC537_01745 [Candidatus Methanosuratincola sp.]
MVAAVTVNAQRKELKREAEATDLLKGFEFTSYNLLFDLCSYLKAHENFTSLEEANQGITHILDRWCSQINSNPKSGGVCSLSVHIESVLVEEYSGQAVDSWQMRFAGKMEGNKWLVTGELHVEFWGGEMLFRANHRIRIAI